MKFWLFNWLITLDNILSESSLENLYKEGISIKASWTDFGFKFKNPTISY